MTMSASTQKWSGVLSDIDAERTHFGENREIKGMAMDVGSEFNCRSKSKDSRISASCLASYDDVAT